MTLDKITEALLRMLAPLKDFPQQDAAPANKLEDFLKTALTQNNLFVIWDSLQPPLLEGPSPDTLQHMQALAQSILAATPLRNPNEPEYWMRERSFPLAQAPDGTAASQMVPLFSLGPLQENAHTTTWIDVYHTANQFAFYASAAAAWPYLVVHFDHPFNFRLPETNLQPGNCTLWLQNSAVCDGPAPEQSYSAIRATQCDIRFQAAVVITDVRRMVVPPAFTVSFAPEALPINDPQPGDGNDTTADLPATVRIRFQGGKGIFEQVAAAVATLLGVDITLQEAMEVKARYLATHQLLHLPLTCLQTNWKAAPLQAATLRISGSAFITNAGWYFQSMPITADAGVAILGDAATAGFLGVETGAGQSLRWNGLNNGFIKTVTTLFGGCRGRISCWHTDQATELTEQVVQLWPEQPGKPYRSSITCTPAEKVPHVFTADAAGYEWHRLFVHTKGDLDRPLSGQGKRFETTMFGWLDTLYYQEQVALHLFAVNDPAEENALPLEQQLKLLHSIALENALLTVKSPRIQIVSARGANPDQLQTGCCVQYLPIYRITHTLPDPYITSQPFEINENLQGLPPRIALLAAVTTWSPDAMVQLDMQLANPYNHLIIPVPRVADINLRRHFRGNIMHPCQLAYNDRVNAPLRDPDVPHGLSPGYPAGLATQADPDNLIGSFAFLQWLPGDTCLVDVSGRASQMGVAFSSTNASFSGLDLEQHLPNTGYDEKFPFRAKGMELVSSGRLVRAFTLPHIQWEPLTYIRNPDAEPDDADAAILNELSIFKSNGAPTRIASSNKRDVALTPKKVVHFIHQSYHQEDKPFAAAAHFSLPFGLCAVAYFRPEADPGAPLPFAELLLNQPAFQTAKQGNLGGAIQIAARARYKGDEVRVPDPYFHGSTLQVVVSRKMYPGMNPNLPEQSVLGRPITKQFNEQFFGAYNAGHTTIEAYSVNAKVPLKRIDFSGYGASIFSNWQDNLANFGLVSQVQFNVLLGRTAHEVVQIRSIIIPWGIPVVRSVIMHRQNHALITRYDTGWQATGDGLFDFRGDASTNPYAFHPGVVKGMYEVTNIRDTPLSEKVKTLTLAGVYFDGNVRLENVQRGGLRSMGTDKLVSSKGQFGYVLLADASKPLPASITGLLAPKDFQDLLLKTGPLGGPVDCVVNIGGSGQLMHISRVEVSATKTGTAPAFIASANGTPEFSQQGSWSVVKCINNKDVVQLAAGESTPLIRKGLLSFDAGPVPVPQVAYNGSPHALGMPADILLYDKVTRLPGDFSLHYAFLQNTPTQKLLFRRPMYQSQPGFTPQGISNGDKALYTLEPFLADPFCLLQSNSIFPSLDKAFKVGKDLLDQLTLSNLGDGFTFPNPGIFENLRPENFDALKKMDIVNEAGFKIYIEYDDSGAGPFQLDLSHDAGARKPWEMTNRKVSIKVDVGPLKPLLTVTGNFHADPGAVPKLETPELIWGSDPGLQCMIRILELLSSLSKLYGRPDATTFPDGIRFAPANAPDSWQYKCSIEQKIPVLQFPDTQMVTLTGPPPTIITASLGLAVFFSLSLKPGAPSLIKPSAGVSFIFEGSLQVMIITLEIATAYAVGSARVQVDIDILDPKPNILVTAGFGATVAVQLPVIGVVSITRTVTLTGSVTDKEFLLMAGTMIRGVLSLAGGLLMTSIQIEGSAGVKKAGGDEVKARLDLIFTLNVSLAFVISYDFSKPFTHEIPFSSITNAITP